MLKACLVLVALLCLSNAQTGNVSVVVDTIQYANGNSGNIAGEQKQQVDFSYQIGEWDNSEAVDINTEWFYDYEGNDKYELYNADGDMIYITPQEQGLDIPAILGTTAGNNQGHNITVADTIGDSVAQSYNNKNGNQLVTSTNGAIAEIQLATNEAQNYIQNSTQSAINALNAANANLSPSALAPYLLVDQSYRDALQNLQNSYNQALANLTASYNKARNANINDAVNAANQAGQDAGAADANVQQAANEAQNAIKNAPQAAQNDAMDAANQAQQAVEAAANNAQNDATQKAQNAANSAQNAASAAGANVKQAANDAQTAVENAPQAAVEAAMNAANQAGQAAGSAAKDVNTAQNDAQSVANAANNGYNAGKSGK